MKPRENDGIKNNSRYIDSEILLTINAIKELTDTVDLMFYLMERNNDNSFVIMLIEAEYLNLQKILIQEKRNTDIVFNIDKNENIFALICQETKVDGGYHFAKRVTEKLGKHGVLEIYSSVVAVKTSRYSAKDIIFRAVDQFVKARHDNKNGEINYKSIT